MSLSDVLEDAADAAVTGRTLDAATIVARAERPEYRPVLRPVVGLGAPRWRPRRGLLVAASVAAVVTLVLAALPAVQRAAPRPATTPTAPGVVPRSIVTPPAWTPTLSERPISRALYVGSDRASVPWVVGADHGEYRRLPVGSGVPGAESSADGDLGSVALSPDGARVAWTGPSRYGILKRLDVVDVATGEHRSLALQGAVRRGFLVQGMAFSRDGRLLALWGFDRSGGGDVTAEVVVVDVSAPSFAMSRPCVLTDASQPPVAAWVDGLVRTPGCRLAGRQVQTPGGPLDTRFDTVPLPPALDREWSSDVFSSPVGADRPTVVTSPDGRVRWAVRSVGEIGPDSRLPLALAATGATAGVRPVPLGTVSGALPLAATPAGVLVSRWTTGTGDADVVLARPDGRVDSVTTTDGRARVAAVAADVVAGGRPGGDARPPARVLESAWWSWGAGRAVGWIPWPGGGFWWVVGSMVVAAAVSRLAVRLLPGRPGVRWTGVVLVVVAAGGLMLVPTDMPRPAASGDGPVVPAVLRDQRLVPPRAFDAVGVPRTTAIGLLVDMAVAGRPGLYGTDAATGALVRLDDLPGASEAGGTRHLWPGQVAVSPDGRWLSNGGVLLDLRTARWTRLADGADPSYVQEGLGGIAEGIGGVAVDDDGTVAVAGSNDHRLWVLPPGGGAATPVAGVDGAFAVTTAGPGRYVVRILSEGVKEGDPLVLLVDVGSPGSTATPQKPVVTPLAANPNTVVAARSTWRLVGGSDGLVLTPSGRRLPATTAVDAAWLVDDRPVGADGPGTLVVLGSWADEDVVISRTPLAGFTTSGDATSELVMRLRLPGLTPSLSGSERITVAAEVVARATAVGPAPDPWWAGIPRP